ncbi:MAG: extracellular solute-binding protein, partial [Proteobacteria bacterium]|nr:extracellular solute-binding protein [Pseudomonadota bacterium]
AKENRNITVWISSSASAVPGLSGGRDQAQILKELADNNFTPYYNINVNLQLAPAGSLLPAALAGIGPDIALQIGGGDVVNYAARNAITNLSGFEGFNDIVTRFQGSALVPYKYDGGTYALPETQTFMMMFYRKDIMEELGMDLPDTWDDVYNVIPVLQKKNLEFGYPMGFNGYMINLMQNNGSLYIKDGVRSNLDSEVAMDAFNQWTELYTNYKLQITYNFINRFRTGEMPIGIADYMDYNQLTLFAPEIKGLWDFMPVPGTVNENGDIDRSCPGGGGGCIMLAQAEDKDAGWEFMKWWTSKDTQSTFSKELECIMGAAARNATANVEAMYELPWPKNHYKNLMSQWQWVKGIPEVPGGYYTTRYLDFAYRSVVNDGEQPEETLLDYVKTINDEIRKKRKEFGLSLN